MRSWLVTLVVGGWILACNPAFGAEIRKSSNSTSCDFFLTGLIEEGDLPKVRDVHKNVSASYPKLCLNSPGGSYEESLKIIKWLIATSNVYTVVDEGAECYSACSLIFIFGNHNEGDNLVSSHRELNVRGTLGFHTPHIEPTVDSNKAQLSAKAYRSGVKAIGQLLELDWDDWFPKSLLIEALKREPEDFLFVDSVQKAAAWNIQLVGFSNPKEVTEAMLESACLNRAREDSNKWMRRWWGAGDSPTGQREEIKSANKVVSLKNKHLRKMFSGFGSEDSFACIVDVYDAGKRGLLLDVNFGEGAKDPKIPRPQNPDQLAKDSVWNGPPTWYLYRGNTNLSNLSSK